MTLIHERYFRIRPFFSKIAVTEKSMLNINFKKFVNKSILLLVTLVYQ